MVKIKFILFDGTEHEIDAAEGDTLMTVGRDHDGLGIEGMCGGFCNCATCHVYVEPAWQDRVPPHSEQEDEMLEGTYAERNAASRLGCQIKITPELEGLTIRVPERQS
jgi:2Fe-2S ferredoxin